MKKIKLIFLVFAIILFLFLLNMLRNYIIVNNLTQKSNNFTLSDNYKITRKTYSKDTDNIIWETIYEYYRKEDTLLFKNTTIHTNNSNTEKEISGAWQNIKSNEYFEFDYIDNDLQKREKNLNEEIKVPIEEMTIPEISLLNLSRSIIYKKDNSYIITIYLKDYSSTFHINIDTGALEKLSNIYKDSIFNLDYIYEKNIVTDKLVEKPNF